VLKRSGWLDQSPVVYTLDLEPFVPQNNFPAATWKSILQAEKQKAIEQKTSMTKSKIISASDVQSFTPNVVKVVDKCHLERKYHTTEHNASIDHICNDYSLNDEQEQAFRIIANHVVIPNSEPLKMYIGGVGGTGKSQVLKAVSSFFEKRNEAYRFIIVAPTGTAASLLSGSTYHSVFGINDISNSSEAQSTKSLIQVRTRLQGVDYIFMDEVSMLSCYDMYRISAQLCKVMNNPTTPFGGYNMLFAGDFAQLPPPLGSESVSLYSHLIGLSGTTKNSQEEALGRALWHQIITVVILRQNMRQKTQSKNDDKLRKALESMRYKDCTPDDIQFLRAHITSTIPGKPCITASEFKFVSIITAKNAQKDEINRLGCEKFAQETGQELVHFYSDDILKSIVNTQKPGRKMKGKRVTQLNDTVQKILWNLPHSSADKPVPGKLSLCMGLPVMIKSNVATELCITNGQETTVVGWHESTGKHKQQILDVLFVQLKSPPKTIQLDGLPENVVPLTHSTVAITCKLQNDRKISISRSQVEILPNFSMTDFASQGKTRPYNPVDLNNCGSHQAYYTALSRSSSADGTVILQGFDSKKITGKASGALCQEFRDLELLDEITKLQYMSKLPSSVHGDRRNSLIHTFRLHKGMTYVPKNVHPSISWNKRDPMLEPIVDNLSRGVMQKSTTKLHANPQSSKKHLTTDLVTPQKGTKRKEITPEKDHRPKIKKMQSTSNNNSSNTSIRLHSLVPQGTIWHQNSCAYDAVLCIIHTI
jgi:hypothetical protein